MNQNEELQFLSQHFAEGDRFEQIGQSLMVQHLGPTPDPASFIDADGTEIFYPIPDGDVESIEDFKKRLKLLEYAEVAAEE